MELEVKSTPNDTIVIACKYADIENNMYTLIPTSILIGSLDNKGKFKSEDGKTELLPGSDISNITNKDNNILYIYPKSVEELTKEYQEKDVNKIMLKFYMDVASKLNLALVDGDNVHIYKKDYHTISKDINGGISKHFSEEGKQVNINQNNHLPTEVDLEHINRDDLAKYLKSHIFENDSILDDIATVIAMNYSAKDRKEITSMLSIGTTGSGKTETFNLISEYLGVPFTMFDCSNMSKTGYQGNSIEDLIKTIYDNSKDKIELLPKSIVVLEEIDKIAARGHMVSDLGVQYELLKFLDGYKYHITLNKTLGFPQDIIVDTSFMTKAGLGAFEELFAQKKKEAFGMGFNSPTSGRIEITDKDIEKYGLTSQIIRRFFLSFLYKELTHDDLKHIATESLGSPLLIKKRRYIRDFNVILEYTNEYLDALIDYAASLKCGAGALTKAVAKSFIKADAAVYNRLNEDMSTPKRLLLTGETMENPCKFTY